MVAREVATLESLRGKRVALPGPKTTATLVARNLLPEFVEVHMDFTDIMQAVKEGDVAAGVIIHEGQLTYEDEGLALLADLGERFAKRHGGLPLPLGVNCVRRDLPIELQEQIANAYRKSVEIAMTQRHEAVTYSLDFGRGLPHETADRFVGMYVNEDSLAFSDDTRRAIEVLRMEYLPSAPVAA